MVDFAHDILEFLQRNHFTDAEAALRSELFDRKSTNGWGSLNDSTSLSTQRYGGGHNENYSGEQRTELRDAAYMHIKSYKSNNLTAYMTSEKGMAGTLKDESDSSADKLRFPSLSSKDLSNKQTDSELKGKELECYSSKNGPYGECRDANSERTLYGNKQVPVSVNGYANGVLGQYKSSPEQRKLQDLAGDSEEMLMFQNGHLQFGNWINYSSPGDPQLGLSGISSEKTRIVKGLSNNVIEAKGNFYETPDGEILPQDMPDVQYSPRKIHSTEDSRDQVEAIPQVDGDNHASKEGDQNLRLHGKENNYFSHDKKTSGPQIANAMLDVEPNIKSYAKFDQGKEESFQEAILAHENGEKTAYIQEHFGEKTGYRTAEHSQNNFGSWKGGPLKTAFPFSLHEVFLNNEQLLQSQALGEVVKVGNEGIGQGERKGLTSTNKGLGGEGTPTRMLNYQGNPQQKNVESPELPVNTGISNELFPRFSSKTFQVANYSYNVPNEIFEGGRRMDSIGPGTESADMESSVLSGPYFHIPGQQEIGNSGKKPTIGSRQGSNDYLRAQWDSGIYDDDNDLGHIRQPVESDACIFPHEIYHPIDNEKWSSRHGKNPNQKDSGNGENENDSQPFAEHLYFSGGQYFPSNNELKTESENPSGLPMAYNNDGKLIGNEETNSLQIGPEWRGFAQQRNGVEFLSDEGNIQRSKVNNIYFVDHHELVRSTGFGSCGEEDAGTNVRINHIAGCTEDLSLYEYKPVKYDRSSSSNNSIDRAQEVKKRKEVEDHQVVRYDCHSWRDHRSVYDSQSGESDPEQCFIKDALKEKPNCLDSQNPCNGCLDFGGLLFPSSSTMGDVAEFKVEPEKSFLSNNRNMVVLDGKKYSGHNMIGPDDILTASRRKSNESLPTWSERDGNLVSELHTMPSITSTHFNYENVERMGIQIKKGEKLNDLMEDRDIERVEDEEAASLGQLIQQMKAQQDQFETFDLQIVHRRNRTGYEEVKDYHAVLNTVIAGRYHVIQNLGSAVFSNVVQVHDLHTGMDVCLKIIKNNKEFFDQSLDEIKLLKLVNKHDPADNYHLLRVYNYFYHREHLFIVCELLKANLYEFYKFNRESGGEAYFTMPRLQSIAIQCLEALQFLHNLGLIHCDLKPENILMKSYSRCEVKVIDLGSSCFETDHLCSNVQSRSYRAPEVILGLPYDKRIDIWSLGCILAELFLGNVLFQSDSSATLLASIIAIVGPIDEEMLVMGCDTHKYFTKSYVLYEQNQDTNVIEFLTPKRTSLKNILTMGDQGFLDFVSYVLEINPKKRPTASAALQHPWLSYTYEPISS